MSGVAGSSARDLTALPGVRAFRSPRFRLVLALMLAGAGVLLYGVFLSVIDQTGTPLLEDFLAYVIGGMRVADGLSPYTEAQLDGPIDAVCVGCYLYPPPLAQALAPLTALPVDVMKVLWAILTAAAAFSAIWLATGIGGARPTLERVAWCVAALAFYNPVFQAMWLGNVSSLLMLAVAMLALGGVAAGLGAAFAVVLKVAPLAFLPAAFVSSSRSRWTLAMSLLIVLALSFMLAPGAWMEYPTVVANMLAGAADVPWNHAPSERIAAAGASDAIVSVVRLASVVAGVGLIAASAWLARRPDGMPAAAVAATAAMLVVPGTLWYHYLAVLLPLAAMAWVRTSGLWRVGLFVAAAIVTLGGLSHAPYTVAGAIATLLLAGWVLWPRHASTPVSEPVATATP